MTRTVAVWLCLASPVPGGGVSQEAPTSDGPVRSEVPTPDRLELLVRDADTAQPIAGARVHLAQRATGTVAELDLDAIRDCTESVVVARTDGQGLASIPVPQTRSLLVVRADTRRGAAIVAARASGSVELLLRRVPTLRARVIDAEGKPISGVPVSIVDEDFGSANGRMIEVTGADGVAELAELDLLRSSRGLAAKYVLALAFPHAEAVRIPVDPKNPAEAPIELVAPPTGRIVVRVVDARGEVVRTDGTVMLDPQVETPPPGPGESKFSIRRPPPLAREHIHRPLRDGVATFEHVGPGLRFEATARVAERPSTSVVAAGPTRAGETVELALPLSETGAVLLARVVDAEGKPIAQAPLHARMGSGSGCIVFTRDGCWSTDLSGRLRGDLSALQGSEHQSLVLEQRTGSGTLLASVVVDLPQPLPAREFDLGDVTLQRFDRLASGRVVDAAGAPIPGVKLVLRWRNDLDGGGPNVVDDVRLAAMVAEAYSDDDGRFELFGKPIPSGFGIVAEKDGWRVDDPHPFELGADDVTIVLARRGSIEGRLLVDSPSALEGLQVVLPEGEGTHGRGLVMGGERASLGPDGAFRFEEVDAGRYTIRVTRGAFLGEDTVVAIDGVEVRPGETCRDPRLQPIDLRAKVRGVTLEILTPDGKPVAEGEFLEVDQAGKRLGWCEFFHDGKATLSLPTGTGRIELRAEGFRTEYFDSLTSDRTIRLRPGIPVRVRIEPFPLSFGLRPLLLATNDRKKLRYPNMLHAEVDDAGEFLVALHEPGSFDLSLYVDFPRDRRDDFDAKLRTCRHDPPRLEVADSDEEQLFVITLDAEDVTAIEKALQDR